MKFDTHLMADQAGRTVLAAALALGVGVLPLAGCGSQPASDATEAETGEPAQEDAAAEATPIDTSSWKTMGDALAARTGDLSYGLDDTYFVGVFDAGDSKVRVVAKSQPGIDEAIGKLDFENSDYDQQLNEALSSLELVSAEDITDGQLPQEQLEGYIGQTGQDLLDAGFVFSSYSFYGGEETGATMDYGNYSYEVSFDATVSEEQAEDGGEAIKGATVTAVESFGNLSNAALDPTSVK
jgi:hypothetical protein